MQTWGERAFQMQDQSVQSHGGVNRRAVLRKDKPPILLAAAPCRRRREKTRLQSRLASGHSEGPRPGLRKGLGKQPGVLSGGMTEPGPSACCVKSGGSKAELRNPGYGGTF